MSRRAALCLVAAAWQRSAADDPSADGWEDAAFENGLPGHLLAKWRRGAAGYAAFKTDFLETGAVSQASVEALLDAAQELTALSRFTLGPDREFTLYGRLQDVYAPLARDDAYCGEAASWAIQRAVHPHGSSSYATDEASPATVWNAAVCSAIMYYRRAGDHARAESTLRLANQHPHAATKFERVDQTPLVFHPGLTARPFWPARGFELVRRLEAAFAAPTTRAAIDAELDGLIASRGLQRLLSPVAPLQPGSYSADAEGEGAWSELPLYDGRSWSPHAARCPTLHGLLASGAGDGPAAAEICRAPDRPAQAAEAVPNLCGTAVVVTVLRLAAGARVTPHCGVTNKRLIMQFALRGSEGVTFRVGDESRGYGGDGHAIVFDDSFEHAVEHRGDADRYVLFAILRHPMVPEAEYRHGKSS